MIDPIICTIERLVDRNKKTEKNVDIIVLKYLFRSIWFVLILCTRRYKLLLIIDVDNLIDSVGVR